MPTFDSKEIVRTLLERKGVFPGDPPWRYICTYTNFVGAKTYGASNTKDQYQESQYVRRPILLLDNGVLTEAGQRELSDMVSSGIKPAT